MQISESEWEIMKILWEKHPKTANEIIGELGREDWSSRTIRTFISRLVKKNAISYSKKKNEFYYSPMIDEKDCLSEESDAFLKKYYSSSLSQMVAFFVEDQKLSEDEIAELRTLLEHKGDD